MKKKNIIIVLSVIIVIAAFLGVYFITANKEDKNTNKDNNKTENKEKKKVNIIDVNSKTRPYAVMINCHNGALPQAGLDKAYIVYELMVEGGITRMMALFKDVDVEKIGSSRSARIQFLDYVYENDAIYAHAGGAQDAIERIRNEKINDVDVDGKYDFRCRFAILDAVSKDDDICVYGEDGIRVCIPCLRQQYNPEPNGMCLCLADYIRPESMGGRDRIGVFVASNDGEMEQQSCVLKFCNSCRRT